MRSDSFRSLEALVALLYALGTVTLSFYLMCKLVKACLQSPAILELAALR